eukprot:1271542-Prymnesium_polylepis.1
MLSECTPGDIQLTRRGHPTGASGSENCHPPPASSLHGLCGHRANDNTTTCSSCNALRRCCAHADGCPVG